MNTNQQTNELETSGLFAFFCDGIVTTYKRNDWICGSDEGSCDFIHYIHFGLVKEYASADKERLLVIIEKDRTFPTLKLIDGQDNKVRYRAVLRTKTYSIHKEVVIKKLKTDVGLSNKLLSNTLKSNRISNDRIDNLSYDKAYERVVFRLLYLCARFGEKISNNSYHLHRVFTHQMIGDSINLSRESVSREIMKLARANLVKRSEQGTLVINNIIKLSEELETPASSTLWGMVPSGGQ